MPVGVIIITLYLEKFSRLCNRTLLTSLKLDFFQKKRKVKSDTENVLDKRPKTHFFDEIILNTK